MFGFSRCGAVALVAGAVIASLCHSESCFDEQVPTTPAALLMQLDTQFNDLQQLVRLDLFQQASAELVAKLSAMTPVGQFADHAPEPGSVLYVIKTYSGAYNTKLRAVMDTWGSQVPKSSLIIVGDLPFAEFPVQVAMECGSDAMLGLACRVAHALMLAARTPGNWSWVVIVDDDHYVKTDNLERSLARFDGQTPVGVGCYGCGQGAPFHYCNDAGGFCGGCGYAFSRKAIMLAIQGREEEFRQLHLNISKSKLSESREDMATTCTMRTLVQDMKVQPLGRTGNGDNAVQELVREGGTTKFVAWHHVSPDEMHEMHKLLVQKVQ